MMTVSSGAFLASWGSYSGFATVCVVMRAGARSIALTPCRARLSIIFCSMTPIQRTNRGKRETNVPSVASSI